MPQIPLAGGAAGMAQAASRLDLDCIAEVGQTFDQAIFLLVGGVANEAIGAKVVVHRPILEHGRSR